MKKISAFEKYNCRLTSNGYKPVCRNVNFYKILRKASSRKTEDRDPDPTFLQTGSISDEFNKKLNCIVGLYDLIKCILKLAKS